jgi:glycosyltransferase involved in cell wall biosynthesis
VARGAGPSLPVRAAACTLPPTMVIGFDAKRAFHNATGLGNYSRDVLRILGAHFPEHRYVAYTPRPPDGASLPGGRVEVRGPATTLGRAFPAVWRLSGVVRDLARDGIRLYHGLSQELPAGIERTGIRSVVTIHDLIFERFPEWYAPIDRAIYRRKARSAVRRADLVVAISEQTRRDLVERYDVPEERIRVVYQVCHEAFRAPAGPGALDAVARARGLPERFVLSVGTIERRKNLLLVVQALAGLPGVPLLVVGRRTPRYAREVDAAIRAHRMEDRVRFLTGVSRAELAALYRLATVFVYPSVFEGFGIPILEAVSSGAPVVTTRGGCFPEAGGPGSAYVDPEDANELRSVLSDVLDDPVRRARMRQEGLAHAARFRDESIARDLFRVYEEALAR